MRWDIYKYNGSEVVRFTASVVGETRRTFLHTMRSIRNKREIEALENYFASYTPDLTLLDRQVGLFELMTRFSCLKALHLRND